MNEFTAGLLLLCVGAFLALFLRKNNTLLSILETLLGIAGLTCITVFSLRNFGTAAAFRSWFRLPVALIGIASLLHAPGYFKGHADNRLRIFFFFFHATLLSMFAVTMAAGKLDFLIAWELMGLLSFALVAFERESAAVLKASWIYLLACEAGGLLLIALFALPETGTIPQIFLLFTAFGLKAGFPLLHVWLPEAHPAAPAPVSALMSGAMIPLGFYGIIFFLPHLSSLLIPGWIFLILGITGSLSGIMSALPQKDLKKLLAYSSVENIGIICMGFGLGFFGTVLHSPVMTAAGFSGAALHILNHALLKGTLFLGAGSVFKAVHTLNVDRMGGLIKALPRTGALFTLASIGISGLPPFCGFTSELLIYYAAFLGITQSDGFLSAGCFLAAIALALTGGIACAVFCKAAGSVFLGEPRTPEAVNAPEEEGKMVFALAFLSVPSFLIPLAAPWIGSLFMPSVLGISGFPSGLFTILMISGILCTGSTILALLLYLFRHIRKGSSSVRRATWDCGYARPTARMAYTGTAISQPLADFFAGILHPHKNLRRAEGLFPEKASIDIENDDYADRLLWRKIFRWTGRSSEKIHKFQSGYLHLYILIMVLALFLMLLRGFCVKTPPSVRQDHFSEEVSK